MVIQRVEQEALTASEQLSVSKSFRVNEEEQEVFLDEVEISEVIQPRQYDFYWAVARVCLGRPSLVYRALHTLRFACCASSVVDLTGTMSDLMLMHTVLST
jgi:Tfp pilus assembly ATPase PilU